MRACPLIFTYSIDRAMPSLAMFSLSGERAEEEQEVQTLLKELFHQCDAGTALEKEEAANKVEQLKGLNSTPMAKPKGGSGLSPTP